ncbi:MAG: ATP synthase F0 subunit B [Bryobacteraceae bacterium]|nr:ATP synthase F0 subunit B [Bryobacteraceae bacterium]
MDQTLQALGGILLNALPTLVLVLLLHFYLKKVFFEPLGRILKERHAATEGARQAAQASLARASERAAAYEQALRDARTEIYREQEELRRGLLEEQSRAVQEAREKASRMVEEARLQLASELEAGKRTLQAQSEELAELMTRHLLHRSARA